MQTSSQSGIFRCVREPHGTLGELIKPKNTMRPPGNVPYIVDNLWEWKRPKKYPSRRYSVFASPRPELAKNLSPEGGKVYHVDVKGKYKLCQVIGYMDSKFHPECKTLKKLILDKLGRDWVEGNLSEKEELGRLWIPCLKKDDMNFLFGNNRKLREIRDGVYNSINYWDNVVMVKNNTTFPDEEGELFFEPLEGYWLRNTQK
jgi:hypothetical protein